MSNETLTAEKIRQIFQEENRKNIERFEKQQESIDLLHKHIQNGSTPTLPRTEQNPKQQGTSNAQLLIAIVWLGVTIVSLGLGLFAFNSSMFQSVNEEMRDLRTEIQHVNDRIDDIYVYLLENEELNP